MPEMESATGSQFLEIVRFVKRKKRPNGDVSGNVGHDTNSTDPKLMRARIFVGNLNTFKVTRHDLENIFQRYGPITAISMHKGYAFVQFMNELHARAAATDEQGNIIAGQPMDINIACEPKSSQIFNRALNEECYSKKQKLQRDSGCCSNNSHQTTSSEAPLMSYASPDILICGNCKDQFEDMAMLVGHKRSRCKLRVTCKCQQLSKKQDNEPEKLCCTACKQLFANSWDLVSHVQMCHGLPIYMELFHSAQENGSPPANKERTLSSSTVMFRSLQDGMTFDDRSEGSSYSHETG
ncbi:PREDICTED: uncharacterized RNA-binding protein C3H8.09c-like isoform X2 [Priapulus caudatus]|uniref:Uncharacterized RNA-binding protein C3H8.09c-like isoform X2 n=1 Tax=Priapulus caudatus TaxID=37621 RepID=A0ABM1DPL8_PRICU|nr:PREDICTED: uncharacterized RNA-binding protein C3H8.09c-like isoform X2 [Priapulus caudatus]